MTQRRKTLPLFERSDDGLVRLHARVTPGAAKSEIAGLWRGPDGEKRLSIKVTAPPDKGKANAAVLKLLSLRLGLPKSALSIMAGETSRLKTVAIAGDSGVIAAAIKRLTGERPNERRFD